MTPTAQDKTTTIWTKCEWCDKKVEEEDISDFSIDVLCKDCRADDLYYQEAALKGIPT